MASRTIPLNKLISWSRNFNVDKDENILKIIFHVGVNNGDYTGVVGDREYHVVPDAATVTRLKNVRDQIIALLQNTVLIEGSVDAVYEVQEVTYPEEVKVELVQIQ